MFAMVVSGRVLGGAERFSYNRAMALLHRLLRSTSKAGGWIVGTSRPADLRRAVGKRSRMGSLGRGASEGGCSGCMLQALVA